MPCFFKSFIQLACIIAIIAVALNYFNTIDFKYYFDGSFLRAIKEEFIYSLQVIHQQQNSA